MTELFHELLGGRAGEAALITDEETVTFGALRERVRTLLGKLFGDSAKRLALCFLPNSLDLVLTYLGTVTAGHAIGLLPPATPAPRKRLLIDRYRPDVVVAGDHELDEFAAGRGYRRLDPMPGGAQVWGTDPDPGTGAMAGELTLLLSTSGSTGTPKLVRISASNIAANTAGIISSTRITPDRRAVTSLPLCYSYGVSILNSHLAAGAALVVTGLSPVTPAFWQQVRRHEVTEVAGTPMTHRAILRRQPAASLPASVRVLTQAGGRLPEELGSAALAWARETGGEFFCMYGQTEATSRISCLDSSLLADKLGSAGVALPGGTLSIGPAPATWIGGAASAGGDASAGEDAAADAGGDADAGEITYTGPNVMLGYATSRDDLARGRKIDTLRTGDIGYLDGDGFLYVTGRASRFAKVFDRRVSLDDVEEWFGMPRRCAAVTAPDNDALIVLFTTGQPSDLESPRRALAATLGAPAAMLQVRHLPDIPLTVSGKVDYGRLRDAAAQRMVAAP